MKRKKQYFPKLMLHVMPKQQSHKANINMIGIWNSIVKVYFKIHTANIKI